MLLPEDPIMASLIGRKGYLELLIQPGNRQKGSNKKHRWELEESFVLTLAEKLPVDYCYPTDERSAKARTSQE